MKRILISLSIIGVVGAAVIGFTIAYFNDTETSTGNIFVAGTMDLKVDHKYSMYNGKECTSQCIENVDPSANLILNGDFEVPEVTDPAKWQIFQTGTTGLEWTVEWNGGSTTYGGRTRPEAALVEYHEGVLGNAAHGDQYAELDSDWYGPNDPLNGEPALIKIYQNVATTIGTKYKLHYYYAPRPNTAVGQNILDVEINDVNVAHHDLGAGGGSILWQEYTYEFVAGTTSTKVEFIGGGTNDSLGVFLDYVTLNPYVCNYIVVGGNCKLWELKDLGQGDYFWNFGDIKPGDYGTNIISLHAYSNDAFACLITNNVIDLDNTLVEPESSLGDTLAIGELSPFVKIFAWEESGTPNNIYDIGETILIPVNSPLTTAMNPKIALTASNTKYIGLAWCVGTQGLSGNTITCNGSSVGDIAQTDSFTAFITAYAEQQRNNAGFNCANVQLPIPVKN
jgi:predicted ribosomally synthesized peptide with SipW-like signal peptide